MDSKKEFSKDALDHAWQWFEYHADQRMTMVRFYIIIVGAIATGIGYLWQAQYFLAAASLGSIGTIIAIVFARLDARVSDLVKLGEAALADQQRHLSQHFGSSAYEICKAADDLRFPNGCRRKFWPYTYGESIRLLVSLSALAFAIVAFSGFYMSASNP